MRCLGGLCFAYVAFDTLIYLIICMYMCVHMCDLFAAYLLIICLDYNDYMCLDFVSS